MCYLERYVVILLLCTLSTHIVYTELLRYTCCMLTYLCNTNPVVFNCLFYVMFKYCVGKVPRVYVKTFYVRSVSTYIISTVSLIYHMDVYYRKCFCRIVFHKLLIVVKFIHNNTICL